MIWLEQLVKDKSVALVGSAASLLEQDCAQQIDAHEVVIRMNLSIPGQAGPADKVGSKTDVWCMGRSFASVPLPQGVQHLLFMKLTKTGDREWPCVQRREVPATRWPRDYEGLVKRYVGSSPGTGIRILYWLTKLAQPSSVTVFGMDCWDTPSSWSGAPAPAHDPSKEKVAMKALLKELAKQ